MLTFFALNRLAQILEEKDTCCQEFWEHNEDCERHKYINILKYRYKDKWMFRVSLITYSSNV